MENIIFKLNKIAFNNSCNSNFVSLSLEKNTHISGINGSGKSSKLNGVQLGFLPHTSFYKSTHNFYFKSSKGNSYSDKDSYDFYFPHNNSYIIFEFSNPSGVFCQIIYKGKNDLSIERAFIPCSLSEIYHWFWTITDTDELGFPTHITKSELIDKIKSQKGYKIVKTTKEAKEVLYNNNFNDESSRFAIANINENKMDNVIDIFKLTANASEIDDKLLRKTIISFLNNSYKDNKSDLMNYDPIFLMQEFDRLEKERSIINKRKNLEPKFKDLSILFSNIFDKSKQIKQDFQSHYEYNLNFISSNKDLLHSLENKQLECAQIFDKVKKEGNYYRDSINQKKGEQNTISRRVAKLESDLLAFNALFDPEHESGLHLYKNDLNAALRYCEDTIEQYNEELKDIKNIERTFIEFKNIQNQIKNLESKLKNAKKAKDEYDSLLVATGKLNNPNILMCINDSFKVLPDSLPENIIQSLNDFTSIFKTDNKVLTLGNISFGKLEDFSFSKEENEKQIKELEDELHYLIDEKNKKQKAIDSQDPDALKHAQDNLNKSKKERSIIESGSSKAIDLKETKEEALVINEELTKLDNEYQQQRARFVETKEMNNKYIQDVSCLKKKLDDANKYINDLDVLKKDYSFNYIKDDSLHLSVDETTNSNIQSIKQLFKDIEVIKKQIVSGLEFFVSEDIISDDAGLLKFSNISINDLKMKLFENIKSVYLTLEDNERSLNDSFSKHASTTFALSHALKNQLDHYKLFEKELNQSIKYFKLSSVDETKLDIELDPTIVNFIEDVGENDLFAEDAESLLEKGFAQKIRKFIEDMNLTTSKNMVINTESIVKNVSFRYKVDGKWTSKDGSTGTSIVASIMLLSLFINTICGEHTILSIPINLDETGNIDAVNIETLNNFLKEKQLVMFSASPELQLSSALIFETLINFDDAIIFDKDRLMDETNRTTYHFMMNSLLNKVSNNEIKVVSFSDDN